MGATNRSAEVKVDVPTSWKRAGKSACPPTRAIRTTPSSSGCAQRLKHRAREFRKLVQDEHSAVRERTGMYLESCLDRRTPERVNLLAGATHERQTALPLPNGE
jgi:hypothetical protein